jgi:hypothetical protein
MAGLEFLNDCCYQWTTCSSPCFYHPVAGAVAVATAVETTTASVGKVAAAAVVMATVAMKAKAARGGMDDEGGKGNDKT